MHPFYLIRKLLLLGCVTFSDYFLLAQCAIRTTGACNHTVPILPRHRLLE